MFYKERTYAAVLGAAAGAGLPDGPLANFAAWLPAGRVDQKRRDATAMLAAIGRHLAAGAPPLRVSYRMADTAAWRAACRRNQ
jgi:hypothetical protein